MSLLRLVLSFALVACIPVEADDDDATPVAEPTPAPINAWNDEGPYGIAVYDTARDFDFATDDGEFDLKDSWTGDDSYVFLHRVNNGYGGALWGGDVGEMLANSVPNVHYFFVSSRSAWEDDHRDMRDRLDAALAAMSDEDAAHWAPRLHVANTELNDVGGLVEEVLETWPDYGFAIDRFQRLRQLGLMQYVGDGQTGNLWFLSHIGRYYDYEFGREQFLADNPADHTIELWDEFQMESDRANAVIDIPDVSAFDTLEVDLTMGCTGHDDNNCFEWDYKARMNLCSTEIDPPDVPATCTPEETDDEGNVITPADTLPCSCASPYAGVEDAVRTCRPVRDDEGAVIGGEYSDCACTCGPQIARWITPYHREGRWLTDISPMLGFMTGGGPARIFIDLDYPFLVSSELRFSNRGKATQPFAAIDAWGGGGFNSSYNENHPPVVFEAPEGTTGVALSSLITGHGFNGDAQNCAEFCPHAHSFRLNGGPIQRREFDEARNFRGCTLQVADGAVPNQFGTWYLGRGGWCPGMDVPPIVYDFTEDLDLQGENSLSYTASLDGREPNNHGSIWMNSYVVFYRDVE